MIGVKIIVIKSYIKMLYLPISPKIIITKLKRDLISVKQFRL